MSDLDELLGRLLSRYDCLDVVEFAHYHSAAHEAFVELRKARSTIEAMKAQERANVAEDRAANDRRDYLDSLGGGE